MKFFRSSLALLGVSAALLVAAPTSRAALVYTSGDLFMGFMALAGDGAGQSYVVNLGSAATFRDMAEGSSIQLSIGNTGLDLVSVFGADWKTREDVLWGFFGTTYNEAANGDPVHTLYAGKAQSVPGTIGIPWNRGSTATQSQVAAKIFSFAGSYANQNTSPTVNSPVGLIQQSSDINDFFQWHKNNGNQSFDYYNLAMGNFANGTAGTGIDLFRAQTGNSSLLSSYEGTFTINDSGNVRFTVVPEPSVLALLVLGVGLAALRHRRAARA